MGDSETKFKEDHLVLPVATPLPHHSHTGSIKSGYQHDVLNSSGLHPASIGVGSAASDGSTGAGLQSGLNGSSATSGLDKYGDMSSLHLAHNRFLMPIPMLFTMISLKMLCEHWMQTNFEFIVVI